MKTALMTSLASVFLLESRNRGSVGSRCSLALNRYFLRNKIIILIEKGCRVYDDLMIERNSIGGFEIIKCIKLF